jgi:hypothetical protein
VYPLKEILEVILFLMVPRTWPASEFHRTWSPTLKSCVMATSSKAIKRSHAYKELGDASKITVSSIRLSSSATTSC